MDNKIANYLVSTLDSEKAQIIGALFAVIVCIVVIVLGFSDLDVFLIGALVFVAGSVSTHIVMENRLESKSHASVLAQSPTERIELIHRLRRFADEGTDEIQNRAVYDPGGVDSLAIDLVSWTRRFLDDLEGKVLASEFLRLQKLGTFRLRGLSGRSPEHVKLRERAAERAARLRALADRIEEPPNDKFSPADFADADRSSESPSSRPPQAS
jgi:hypothetical protein